ncbi:MAG: hypothetical protein SOR93_09320 [Clostridiales Family XIII bacterium]|nr:hypothetical protein [Clostridiales Family XIII bacterium]
MILEYKGVEITESVSIYRCWHDMFAQDKADMLTIMFDDIESLWDNWNPQSGDEIVVKNDEISTGTMYVHKKTMRGRFYTLIAASAPLSSNVNRSKAWQDVRLLQIGNEIAEIHNLDFKSFGVENVLYSYILQKNEPDFTFLNRICALEGCAFLIYDKALILYSIEYMENMESADEILLDEQSKYQLFDTSGLRYGTCKIVKGKYRGAYDAQNGSNKLLIPNMQFDVSSATDAIRFAKNLLIRENNSIHDGFFYTGNIYPAYTPGAVLDMQIARIPSWDGRMLITAIRNDYIADKSKVFFRKIEVAQNDR